MVPVQGGGISVSETDGYRAYHPYTSRYTRLTAHNGGDQDNPYVLDIFRVKGGWHHEYTLHGDTMMDMEAVMNTPGAPVRGQFNALKRVHAPVVLRLIYQSQSSIHEVQEYLLAQSQSETFLAVQMTPMSGDHPLMPASGNWGSGPPFNFGYDQWDPTWYGIYQVGSKQHCLHLRREVTAFTFVVKSCLPSSALLPLVS